MHWRAGFNSILTRLLLLGLMLVVVGAVLRYFILSDFFRENLSTVVAEQQLALATYVARDVDYKVSERRHLLQNLAMTLPTPLLERPETLRAWLRERFDFQPVFSLGLMVLDLKGQPLASYPAHTRPFADYADRDYFQAARGGAFFIGRPLLGRTSQQAMLPMAAPVVDAQGAVVAVLVGATALDTPGFLDSLMQGRIGHAGGFLLVSPRDQVFVASSRPEMVLRPTPAPGVNLLHDRAMAGFRGTGITVNAQGEEELSAMVSVPSADWFVVARLPTTEAFSTLGRLQRFIIRNAMLATVIFGLLFSMLLYWSFLPLFRAVRQADRMTLGVASLQPLVVVRNDEVGNLIAAFNRLLVKLQENQAELARMAHHDALTGLPNRRLLIDRLQQALAQAQRSGARLALFFLDLDGFKPINDRLGHEGGDEALREVAARFFAIVRQGDTLARIGGDEFVLLIGDLDEAGEAAVATVAGKFIEALQAPLVIAGQPCRLGVSIGIALGNGKSDPDAFLLAADQAMYRAKAAGRGCYVIDRGTT